MRMQLEREPNWVWEADNLELFQVEHLPRPHLSAHAGRVQIKSRSAALWLPREGWEPASSGVSLPANDTMDEMF